ncbi:MAG TPA: thermonuclease family protein [Candidatus Wallbacteria bacterium]|nr:thermonuclease family protein [Candidatus Wallbacteria bacterium]
MALILLSVIHTQLFAVEARFIRVVDGDTLKINYSGKNESIRLIGIDTPESYNGSKASRDARRSHTDVSSILELGRLASTFVKGLLKKDEIINIEFDVTLRDRYGRLLGYIYLPSGKMLNEEIIKAGYANVMTVPPNVRYSGKFLDAYKYAKEKKLGLWKE